MDIGHKGIGFKSAFKLSACPSIRSGVFHFAFDCSIGDLGHVVPTWVDDDRDSEYEQSLQHSVGSSEFLNWKTRFLLPLRPQISAPSLVRDISSHVTSHSLLFLRKIRSVRLVDCTLSTDLRRHAASSFRLNVAFYSFEAVTAPHVTFAVVDKMEENSAEKNFFLILKRVISEENPSRSPHSLRLAFPMSFDVPVPSDILDESAMSESPSPLQGCLHFALPASSVPLFSFLPVRPYGFRFYVQSDFVLTSSREAIDETNLWNLHIRTSIPDLVVDAIHFVKHLCSTLTDQPIQISLKPIADGLTHSLLRDSESPNDSSLLATFAPSVPLISSFLNTLPRAGELEDFFSVVWNVIHSTAQTVDCLLSHSSQWTSPSQCYWAPSLITEKIMSLRLGVPSIQGKYSARSRNLNLIHSKLLLPPSLRHTLNVRPLLFRHIVETMGSQIRTVFSANEASSPCSCDSVAESIPLIRSWYSFLYGEFRRADPLLTSSLVLLMKSHIAIPIQSNVMCVCGRRKLSSAFIANSPIYFPCGHGDGVPLDESLHRPHSVCREILDSSNANDESVIDEANNARMLLKSLGVTEMSLHSLFCEQILSPLVSLCKSSSPSLDRLIKLTIQSASHMKNCDGCRSDDASINELRQNLYVVVCDGSVTHVKDTVVFSSSYCPQSVDTLSWDGFVEKEESAKDDSKREELGNHEKSELEEFLRCERDACLRKRIPRVFLRLLLSSAYLRNVEEFSVSKQELFDFFHRVGISVGIQITRISGFPAVLLPNYLNPSVSCFLTLPLFSVISLSTLEGNTVDFVSSQMETLVKYCGSFSERELAFR